MLLAHVILVLSKGEQFIIIVKLVNPCSLAIAFCGCMHKSMEEDKASDQILE